MARQLSEDEIVQAYRQTIRPLYAWVSRRVGGDRALAEDLVQDTWLRALEAWPARGGPDEPLAWLMRVARNVLVSHFRRTRPQPVDPATLDFEAGGTPDEEPDNAALVSWGLSRVRRRHADVLEAFYFDGKSIAEIARERSLSERAVEGRLHRARAVLKKTLSRMPAPHAKSNDRRARGEAEHARHARTP